MTMLEGMKRFTAESTTNEIISQYVHFSTYKEINFSEL